MIFHYQGEKRKRRLGYTQNKIIRRLKKGVTHEKEAAAAYESEYEEKAVYYLEGLGGKENIKDVTNCATRLRVTVIDPSLVKDSDYFTNNKMAHGLAKSGQSIQIIVGLSVPQVRDSFETKL